MTARFSNKCSKTSLFATKTRGHRPRLQLRKYRLIWNSSRSGRLKLFLRDPLVWNFVESAPIDSHLRDSVHKVAEIHRLHNIAVHAESIGFQHVPVFLGR